MLFALFLLIGFSGGPNLFPAPGQPFALPPSLGTSNGQVSLSASGEGRMQDGDRVSSPELRHYVVVDKDGAGPATYYFPKQFSLLRWPLFGVVLSRTAQLLVKPTAGSWVAASSFSIILEKENGETFCRFALPTGQWDVALIVPGFVPAIAPDRNVAGESMTLPLARLEPAGEVRGRMRDGRSGAVLQSWKAYLRDPALKAAPSAETAPAHDRSSRGLLAGFLEERPIASGGPSLKYSSVPAGGWELRVEASGYPMRRQLVGPVQVGAVVDVGDIYFAGAGALRLSITFPVELPDSDLTITVYEGYPAYTREARNLIAERRRSPKPALQVDFDGLKPEELFVLVAAPSSGLWRELDVSLVAGQRAEISLEFLPIRVRGQVWYREAPFEGARVRIHGSPGNRVEAYSDAQGHYQLTLWVPSHYGMTTFPPGERTPFWENLDIPPGISVFEHDIKLPDGVLLGTVVADHTDMPIAGAAVSAQTPTSTEAKALQKASAGRKVDAQFWGAVSSADGSYRVEGLLAQAFDVTAEAPGYTAVTASGIIPSPAGQAVDFRLKKSRVLRGRVLDESGAPLGGALVGIDFGHIGLASESVTDTAGDFTFEDMSEGSHSIVAYKCGYSFATATAGTTDDVTIRLQRAGPPLTVAYFDGNNRPVKFGGGAYEVKGTRIPQGVVGRFLGLCGVSRRPDGAIMLDVFPEGTLRMFDAAGRLLSTFAHDGSNSTWTVPVAGASGYVEPLPQ